jgi:RND family efflux transporter MFP subunit
VTRILIVILLFGTSLAASQVDADDPAGTPSEQVVVLRRSTIEYERISSVGSSLFGILKECFVEPGSEVKEGQVLGRLVDADVRAELQLRELEAGSDIDIRLSQNKEALALRKLKGATALMQRNAVSRLEYTQQRLEAEAATLDVENAKRRRRVAEALVRQSRAVLQAREFVSPHGGVVTAVLKRRGEPVAPNVPLFRVVDVDHLVVTGQVDVIDVWRLQVGQPVKIIPDIAGADLPVEHEVFPGRIVFIDTHIDPMSQCCTVLAKCDNRHRLLRAGLEARMEISTEGTTAAAGGGTHRRPAPAAAGGLGVPRGVGRG